MKYCYYVTDLIPMNREVNCKCEQIEEWFVDLYFIANNKRFEFYESKTSKRSTYFPASHSKFSQIEDVVFGSSR